MASYYLSGAGATVEGPFSDEEIRRRLESGELDGAALITQEGWSDWKPAGEVLLMPAVIPNALDTYPEIQQAARPAVESVRARAEGLLTSSERILGITAQVLPGVSHDGVVITNRRLLLIRPKLGGLKMSFEDWAWLDVTGVHIEEMILGTTFSVTGAGRHSQLERLHKEESRGVYRLAQQLAEAARNGRRYYHLEELKAGAAVFGVTRKPEP